MSEASSSSFPLSTAQAGVWMAQQLNPATRSLFLSQSVELAGPIDVGSFRRAVQQAYAECDALRLRILVGADGFRQEVRAGGDIDLPVIDVSDADDPRQAADAWMRADLAHGADLTGSELFSSSLLKLAPDRFAWYQRCHHVVMDGYSSWLFAQRVAAIYTALASQSLCPRASFGPLRVLIEEEAAYRASDAFERDKAYWNARLGDKPVVVGLAEVPALAADENLRCACTLSPKAVEVLTAAAGYSDQGWSGVVIAAVAAYLHRATGTQDVILGLPVTARRTPTALRTPGMLANVLPLRLDVRPEMSIVELIQLAARQAGRLLRHQRYNHESLRRDLKILDSGGRLYGPEVNILFLDLTLDFAGIPGVLSNVSNGPVEDLAVYAYRDPADNELHIDFAANPRCHSAADVAAHATRLAHFVDELAAHVDEPIDGIDILPPGERQRVLLDWNQTQRQEGSTDVVGRIRAIAASSPASVAASDDRQRIDYAALVARSSALSRRLAAAGTRPGTRCAVLTGRGAHAAVTMLGIWGAGGAYVPLDVHAPAARTRSLLHDSGARLLIVDPEHERMAGEITAALDAGLDIVVLDEAADAADGLFPVAAAGDDLAYICRSAGPGRRPRAAMVGRRGMINHLLAKIEDLGLTAADSVVHNAPLTLDTSVWQLIAPLLAGGRTRVAGDATAADPFALAQLMADEGLTVAAAGPSFLRAALELWGDGGAGTRGTSSSPSSPSAPMPHCRWVVLSAAALPPELCARWFEVFPQVGIVNAYGQAECSGDVCHAMITRDSPAAVALVPLGRPIRNTRLYVLSGALRSVPAGMPGELYVGGTGVGPGYLGDPRLTCAAYVPDPFQPGSGARMYRTGDRVRYLPDGQIEFLGRRNFQAEVRGERVDLREVEAALAGAPGASDAVVTAQATAAGEVVLVGYVAAAEVSGVRAHAAALLPDYAVPPVLICLQTLPRDENGDVDAGALPTADLAAMTAAGARPGREQKILREVFAEVLGVPEVGASDSFFTLGGDSILVVAAVSRAAAAGLAITPRDVFQLKTPEALAYAATAATAAPRGNHGSGPDDGAGWVPATPAMHWWRETGGPIDGFHQSVLVNVPADLGQAALTSALQALLDRHDMLRARLVRSQDGAVWGLRASPAGDVRAESCVRRVDVSGQSAAGQQSALEAEFAAARARLAPGAGEMVQAVWFDHGTRHPGRLLLVIHHLVVDGVSWRILLPDLSAAWHSARSGREAVLEPAATSFRRWSEGLLIAAQDPRWAGTLPVWKRMLQAPAPLVGRRPLDRNVDVAGRTRSITLNLDSGQTETLVTKVTAAFTASVRDVLLTGLALAIAGGPGGGPGVLIDLEGHGREELLDDADVSRAVGWFTSIFPVRVDLGETGAGQDRVTGECAATVLKRVKEQLRDLPAAGAAYGLLRYLNPVTRPVLAKLPSPEVCFNYLGRFSAPDGDGEPWLPRADSAALASLSPDVPVAHTLEVVAVTLVQAGEPRLSITLTWPEGAMEPSAVRRIGDEWLAILGALTEHVVAAGAGGLTPSDVPLVSVSQAEIEELENLY